MSTECIGLELDAGKLARPVLLNRGGLYPSDSCQMIELVEERVPEWIGGNPTEIPGMILVVGITNDFEEMVVNHTDDHRSKDQQKTGVNLKPFQDLKRALGSFSKGTKFSPYIVFLTTLHSKSQVKLAGGQYFSHFCNVIARVNPFARYCMYYLD